MQNTDGLRQYFAGRIMTTPKFDFVLGSLLALTTVVTSPIVQPVWAQSSQGAQQKTMPPQAPSFLKQAGQKFLDSAQKKVLQNVNERLQSTPTTPAVPADPNSVDPNATTVAVPGAPRQAPPCRTWILPGEKPVACLLCIHGLGLQSNSYEFFGKEQSNRGIAVYAIDVRGFGSWIKAKGKTKMNFDECLEDIKLSLESIRAANPGVPVYILGESMGGAIALRAASMYPDLIDGLVSSVPAGERFNQGKTSMKVFLNLLTGVNIADVGGDILNQATKSAKLKSQWQDDPLARLNLSPQELIQFQDFMNNNHEAAKKVADMPVLFVQGTGDQLVKPEGTWELFNSVTAKDKSFFAVPGEHLIFEEAQTQEAAPRDQNFRVISSWLSTKVGRRHRPGRGMSGGSAYGGNQSAGGYGQSGSGQGGFGNRMNFINIAGLEGPNQMIESGQYSNAIAELERLRSQRPSDPNVLALLGRAYYQNGQTAQAGSFFRQAMVLKRGGGDQAKALNNLLLGMSQTGGGQTGWTQSAAQYPFAGFGSQPGQIASGIANVLGGAPTSRGRVYAFFANWAEQCKGLGDSLTRLSNMYGDRVDIVRVNIEDADSASLVDKFKVGPIPTMVFVAPNGQVNSTIIGESTYANYEQALKGIARTQ